jgi:hypothetical protein
MTRILLDPEQLAGTSAELRGAAGEYQAIGARVASCDCGCMPPDVAAVVDSTTAAIRSRLNSVSAWLTADSADLAERAGIPQSGMSAVGAAAGGGYVTVGGYQAPEFDLNGGGGTTVVVGGGFDTSVFGSGGGGYTAVVGGGFDTSVFGSGGGGYTAVVGGGFDTSVFGSGGGGYTAVVGGGFDTSVFGDSGSGGYTLVIGGGFDPSVFDPGPGLGPNFNLTDWGLGGTGYGNRTLGSFTPTTIGESMAVLTGMAARNNDWFTLNTLQNIQTSMYVTSAIWALPDNMEIVRSYGYGW